jgi:hypothetical protein
LKEIIEVLVDSIRTYIQTVIMSSNRKSIAKVLRDEVVVKVYRIISYGIEDVREGNFRKHLEKLLGFIDDQVRLGNLSKGHGDTAGVMQGRRSEGEGKVGGGREGSYEVGQPEVSENHILKYKYRLNRLIQTQNHPED